MRCCDLVRMWDELREGGATPSREDVLAHLRRCPHCQEAYEEYEGVAYCLSCLPPPQPSCDLAKRVIQHIATVKGKLYPPIILAAVTTPIGRLYVGLKGDRIAYVSLDTGEGFEQVIARAERRLHRRVVTGEVPGWLIRALDRFFNTWTLDDALVDISDLTPFEQAALRAAARIPPGEVRSYSWVATQIGRPKAARAVGRVMARNPVPLLFPCHRVVDSSGDLHDYFYGLDMKARLLEMEGYRG